MKLLISAENSRWWGHCVVAQTSPPDTMLQLSFQIDLVLCYFFFFFAFIYLFVDLVFLFLFIYLSGGRLRGLLVSFLVYLILIFFKFIY